MLLFIISLSIFQSISAQNVPKTAVTSKGNVNGYTLNLGSNNDLYNGQADVFLSVPFAKPPVGALRFQKPQEMDAWTVPVNGTVWPNQCPQNDGFLPNAEGQMKSEDCLYMNIYSPNIDTTTKYPVMFFIHGGGFATGSVGTYQLNGIIQNFVRRGVVLVIIQHRLNVLGFFTTNTTEFPANLGLHDQVLALKFVQKEIGAFGGDSNRVTIFGQSSGSCSVSAHTYSPLSRGLFQQAIMESGTSLLCFDGTFDYSYFSQTAARQLCNFTTDQWNAGDFSTLKTCMMNRTFEEMLAVKEDLGALPWPMSIDGDFMPDFPRNLAAQRPASYNNMPIMIGTVRDEWGFWELAQIVLRHFPLANYTRAYSQQEMAVALRFYGEKEPLVTNIINSVYVDPPNLNDTQNEEWLKVVSRWHTDAAFEALAVREIDLWLNVNQNPNVYLYRYSYRSLITSALVQFANITGWDAVGHGEELYFLFMLPTIWNAPNAVVTDVDKMIADWLGKTWTDFAKTGNLTVSAGWEPVRNDYSFNFLEIAPPTPTMRRDYGHNARTIFNQVIPKLTFIAPQIPPPMGGNPTVTTPPPGPTTPDAGGSASTAFAHVTIILITLLIIAF